MEASAPEERAPEWLDASLAALVGVAAPAGLDAPTLALVGVAAPAERAPERLDALLAALGAARPSGFDKSRRKALRVWHVPLLASALTPRLDSAVALQVSAARGSQTGVETQSLDSAHPPYGLPG